MATIRTAFQSLGNMNRIFDTVQQGYQNVNDVINIFDDMTSKNVQLNLLVEDNGSVGELQNSIFEAAKGSRSSYPEMVDTVTGLRQGSPEVFSDNDETIAFAEVLNKQFIIAGATQEEMSTASMQMVQALGSGVLQGEELNTVFKAAPNVIQSIADYLHVPIGKIQEMASEGEITSQIVKNAMLMSIEETNQAFDSMPMTFSNIWTSLKNESYNAVDTIVQKINEMANNVKFQTVVDQIINSLDLLVAIVTASFDILSLAAEFIYDNWSLIEPIIWGVVAALFVYNATMGIAWFTTLRDIGAKLWSIAVSWAQTAAIFALMVAQDGLNAALAACPLTWILIGIIAIIAIFYAAVAAVNHFAGTSYSATGLIAGAFAVLGAFLWNLFLGVFDFILGIINALVNPFIEIANFIGNVFTNPISSIIYAFHGMADGILGTLQKIASAMDFIFGSNMADTVGNWRAGLKTLADKAVEEYAPDENYQNVIDKLDLSVDSLGLKRFEYSAAWDAGNDWGANLFNSDSPQEVPKDNSYDDIMKGLPDAFGPLTDNGKETAGNTAKMAKSMEGAEEDLKYLRDLAERDVINRFTTAEIKVDFSSQNTINSGLDLDGIIDQFTKKLEEAIDIAAEGA
ncbi:tape measure protein [Sporosarcina sp. Te-1]|uniref:tape measure protein n=1 Tax=Sporosarcina sp. Te-1 TaxID=2818390 RepID=UPI001A9EA055|nr:tape measure protein [Sporosarcina sp. Te-1]QTD40648.1 tape measure protein [Sporosarcina sp. Te-1]